MGTSAARRAPATRTWRRAKLAATRYLSPAKGGLEAREVAAYYLAALEDDAAAAGQDLPGAFPLTRRAAQNLGAWGSQAASRGWEEAQGAWGLRNSAVPGGEGWALALAGALAEVDGSLEGAAVRSSLAAVLQELNLSRQIKPAELVAQFLGEALYQRLVLDLGEPLEAAGLNFGHWRRGLAGLRTLIAGAAAANPEETPPPGNWEGLKGWTWVTRSLERMAQRLLTPRPSEKTIT
jgi:hypothetical protein